MMLLFVLGHFDWSFILYSIGRELDLFKTIVSAGNTDGQLQPLHHRTRLMLSSMQEYYLDIAEHN